MLAHEDGDSVASERIDVIDLFSGAGGMSYGFHSHGGFRIVGAADAQRGKPSSLPGSLQCNGTYVANIGVEPVNADLGVADPADVLTRMDLRRPPAVVLACPPCTGFSRTRPENHVHDDVRNGLVRRTADYVSEAQPAVVVMENARELVMGKFGHHLRSLRNRLKRQGYHVHTQTYLLDEFGLPQRRERAVVVATRDDLPTYSLRDLWQGHEVDPKATYVRRAIWDFPRIDAGARDANDPLHVSPGLNETSMERLQLIPHDGGSWVDLIGTERADALLTPSMKRRVAERRLGSHPDIYGRLSWDRPSVTIKRECGHVGNGRYAHPEQDRLCTVREMAVLQGFPSTYTFVGSIANMYRQIGDAVPPLISFQLAHLVSWILGNRRPSVDELLLPGTHLRDMDVRCK